MPRPTSSSQTLPDPKRNHKLHVTKVRLVPLHTTAPITNHPGPAKTLFLKIYSDYFAHSSPFGRTCQGTSMASCEPPANSPKPEVAESDEPNHAIHRAMTTGLPLQHPGAPMFPNCQACQVRGRVHHHRPSSRTPPCAPIPIPRHRCNLGFHPLRGHIYPSSMAVHANALTPRHDRNFYPVQPVCRVAMSC